MQREGLDTRMSKIAIVTDSNSGITQAEGARRGIHVLPMPFICLLYTSDAADE